MNSKQKIFQLTLKELINQNKIEFCYFPIKQNSSAVIYGIYLLIMLILIIITIKDTVLVFKAKQKNKKAIKQRYILLLFWSIASLIQIIVCQLIFLQISAQKQQNSFNLNSFSKFIFLTTFTIIFLFNFVIYIITMSWLKIIKNKNIQNIEYSNEKTANQALLIKNKQPLSYQDKKLSTLKLLIKIIFWARGLLFVVWVILYCLSQNYNKIKVLAKVLLFSLLIDSFLIIFFLILTALGFKINQNNQQQNNIICKQYKKRCIKTIFPTLFRCVMLSLTLASPYYDFQQNLQLNCELQNKFKFLPYGLMSLGGIGIYVLPFYVMIKVLQPFQYDKQIQSVIEGSECIQQN